jgi:hypothetical protein
MKKNKQSDVITNMMSRNITSTQIDIWFKANNIIHEKAQLFHDFVFSLFNLIQTTYMGDDVTITYEDKHNHFNWCWNKTIDEFEKEKIIFEREGHHYDYFWSFFHDSFYFEDDKDDTSKIESFFSNIFNLTSKKTKSELDMLGDLYKILEKSIKKLY